jgi:hypothetical protein
MSKKNKNKSVADVSFAVDGVPVSFRVIHNMPTRGNVNSFNAALDNWLARTEVFTGQSFCDYVNSKDAGFEAWIPNVTVTKPEEV